MVRVRSTTTKSYCSGSAALTRTIYLQIFVIFHATGSGSALPMRRRIQNSQIHADPASHHCYISPYLNGFRPGWGSWLDPVLVEGRDDVAAVVRLLACHEHQAVFVILHSRVLDLQQKGTWRYEHKVRLKNNFFVKRRERIVADPDPSDLYVFGPPGSGSISQRYGSGFGSFYHQAKIVRKTLIPTALWLLYDFLS